VFWTDTPPGKYEELAEIKTKKLSCGEEASNAANIIPKEEGYYTVYANLYDNSRRIGRDSDTSGLKSNVAYKRVVLMAIPNLHLLSQLQSQLLALSWRCVDIAFGVKWRDFPSTL
jgi:hypothetical protein